MSAYCKACMCDGVPTLMCNMVDQHTNQLVKLERFVYTVRVVVLTSRCKIFPIWICIDVLEHAVLHTAVSTQTSDIHDMSTWVL